MGDTAIRNAHRVTSGRHREPRRSRRTEWLDRIVGSDPGLIRLRQALHAVASIGAAMLAEWIFVGATGAMQIRVPGKALPRAVAAQVAAQHHGVLIIAIIVGALTGMIASFTGPVFSRTRSQLTGVAVMPVLMTGVVALGLAVAPYRIAALATLVVILSAGAYCRRFGPLGFLEGIVAFMGAFLGFFLHGEITYSDLGWLAAEIAIGAAVAVIVEFTFLRRSRRVELRRMLGSMTARAHGVLAQARELFDASPAERGKRERQLQRYLVRLNETALIADAYLASLGAQPEGVQPGHVHQVLFDAELAISNVARFSGPLADARIPADLVRHIRRALAAADRGDILTTELRAHELLAALRAPRARGSELPTDGPELSAGSLTVARRFAVSLLDYVKAVQAWQSLVAEAGGSGRIDTTPHGHGAESRTPGADLDFRSSVTLVGGWLPGATLVNAAASLEAGPSQQGRARMAGDLRVAIQMGVAVSIAVASGDLLSGRRFYWALIAAFVAFLGANNSAEQLRKSVDRMTGTAIGVVLGAIGAHIVGQRSGVAIAVILVAIFLGMYLTRISYAFTVIGITIMVCQLYVQLNEFSNSVLILRVEETAIGCGAAILTVLLVFPLYRGRVLRVAVRNFLEALAEVAGSAMRRLDQHEDDSALRAAVRGLDSAYQTLLATIAPSQVPFLRRRDARSYPLLRDAEAARHYARDLMVDTDEPLSLTREQGRRLAAAGRR